jgi:hypothetical protein
MTEPKKHFQDVYQGVKYCIERDKLGFINQNEVECLGEIINLLGILYLGFKMRKK